MMSNGNGFFFIVCLFPRSNLIFDGIPIVNWMNVVPMCNKNIYLFARQHYTNEWFDWRYCFISICTVASKFQSFVFVDNNAITTLWKQAHMTVWKQCTLHRCIQLLVTSVSLLYKPERNENSKMKCVHRKHAHCIALHEEKWKILCDICASCTILILLKLMPRL